jgi:hypothetical protein
MSPRCPRPHACRRPELTLQVAGIVIGSKADVDAVAAEAKK